MNTILQVISDTNIGGGGRSLLNYLSCQDRSQFQSQVVLPRGSALKGPVEALGVPVHEIDAMADRSMDLSAVAPLRPGHPGGGPGSGPHPRFHVRTDGCPGCAAKR